MKITKRAISSLGFIFVFIFQAGATPDERMDVDQFLIQVKENNLGVKGAVLSSQGADLRSEEGQLLLSPTFFLNAQYMSDAKLPQALFLGYDTIITKTFSFGVKQLTPFGLEAKLHYDLLSQSYVNPVSLLPGLTSGAGVVSTSYNNASPVLELTQSLWSNGFGRSTRATQEQLEAQALGLSYTSSFQALSALTEAESNYWRLAAARQTIAIQEEALDRAKKIYEWNSRQASLHLRETSDVLQAEALMQSRELDLLAAKTEERSAARSFNASRNLDSDQVPERLVKIDTDLIDRVQIPLKARLRFDVKAAQQTTRASVANANLALERDSPTLEAYASIALNGQQGYTAFSNLSDAIPPSFSLNRPTETIGIRFQAPIDLSLTRKTRAGWEKEHIAAELNYDRKLFEQEEKWKDLKENLEESKRHLDLSRKLEVIQRSKLDQERERLKQGRTTTYQVLLFEQDYLLSQLGRVRDQAKILNLIAQMKLFGESS